MSDAGAPPPAPVGARILIVDDSAAVRDMLQAGLTKAGFWVKAVPDGRSVLDIMRSWNPETVLLDVMLPETDGFAVLASLRRVSDVPIIMISGRTALSERVSGLLNGADDYVTKPFVLEELIARLFRALRRPRLGGQRTLSYADLFLDATRRDVVRAGRHVVLSRREFDLLLTLLREPERVFTRAELLDFIWGVDRDVNPGIVESYISSLRAKIDRGEKIHLIRTIRGAGYALSAKDMEDTLPT
jgi:DNA-binding response OmpR family regulator